MTASTAPASTDLTGTAVRPRPGSSANRSPATPEAPSPAPSPARTRTEPRSAGLRTGGGAMRCLAVADDHGHAAEDEDQRERAQRRAPRRPGRSRGLAPPAGPARTAKTETGRSRRSRRAAPRPARRRGRRARCPPWPPSARRPAPAGYRRRRSAARSSRDTAWAPMISAASAAMRPNTPERDRLRVDGALRLRLDRGGVVDLEELQQLCATSRKDRAGGREVHVFAGRPPRRTGRRPPPSARCRTCRCSTGMNSRSSAGVPMRKPVRSASMSSCTTWVLTTPMPVTVSSSLR